MEFRLIIFNIQSTVSNVKSTFIIITFRIFFLQNPLQLILIFRMVKTLPSILLSLIYLSLNSNIMTKMWNNKIDYIFDKNVRNEQFE